MKNSKTGDTLEVPAVPFQMLTALPISAKEWTEIARNAGWQMTRMNLNTFQRHGVFADAEMVKLIADRLRDREAIQTSESVSVSIADRLIRWLTQTGNSA